MTEHSDVAAAVEAAAKPDLFAIDPNQPAALVTPPDWDTTQVVRPEEVEARQAAPNRSHGIVTTRTAAGFIAAVEALNADLFNPSLYVDESSRALVVILNDDQGAQPGWRDHRVQLALVQTPEWQRWVTMQGLKQQETFAEHVETSEPEFVDPVASVMLDLAQNFHAAIGVKVKQARRLSDGRTQLVWDEEIEAKAGAEGDITIPDRFTIRVKPYHGSQPFEIEARLRYRAGNPLQIGYFLDRPDDVERAAFGLVATEVTEALQITTIEGQAPAAR